MPKLKEKNVKVTKPVKNVASQFTSVVSPPKVTKLGTAKPYKLEASLNDIKIKTSGASMLEAVNRFVNHKNFPFALKTKVFLKYSKGKVSRHKILAIGSARMILKRLRFDEDQADFLAEKLNNELSF